MSKGSESAVVYGALRSGTTLLRLMLNKHPQLRCPGEMDFMFDHLIQAPGDGGLSYDLAGLEEDRIYRGFRDKYGFEIKDGTSPQDIITHIAPQHVGLLMIHRRMARMLDALPDTRIIHILRDPRDVARSSIGMGWAGDVYHGAQHWIQTEEEYLQEITRVQPDRILTLHYEDLIRAPEAELARICDFLDVPYMDAMMNYHEDTTYDQPDTSLIEQWRRKLSPKEIGWVEARVGSLLGKTGYEASGHATVAPEGMSLKLLTLQNSLRRMKLRIKRYGLRDVLSEAIARRVGWHQVERQAKRRIQEKQIAYLK